MSCDALSQGPGQLTVRAGAVLLRHRQVEADGEADDDAALAAEADVVADAKRTLQVVF